MKIEFTIPGVPVGKGRPRFTRDGHAHTPQKTRDYEDKAVLCWKCQSGKGFAAGVPLIAHITAYFPAPKRTSKAKKAAMAICAMAEALHNIDMIVSGAAGAVQSASIGSVSTTYGSAAAAAVDVSEKGQAKALYRAACLYLDIYRGCG